MSSVISSSYDLYLYFTKNDWFSLQWITLHEHIAYEENMHHSHVQWVPAAFCWIQTEQLILQNLTKPLATTNNNMVPCSHQTPESIIHIIYNSGLSASTVCEPFCSEGLVCFLMQAYMCPVKVDGLRVFSSKI